jgi:hypothetical protein
MVSVPDNGTLDYSGHDFVCNRGFRRVGQECRTVAVPANAALDYSGHDFVCISGFRRVGSACRAN